MSPTQDSPLPPAPVSAFILDEESQEDARRARPTSFALAPALPSSSRQTVPPRTRAAASSSAARTTRPPASDQDSPGVGRRAVPVQPCSSRLDDLGVPRASYLLQSDRPRIAAASRSSPVVKADDHRIHSASHLDHNSSPGTTSNTHLPPSARSAQSTSTTSSSRCRGSHAPVSSASFAKAGESSSSSSSSTARPTYGSLGRSASYGNGGANNSVEAVRDDARIATRSSMNSIAGGSAAGAGGLQGRTRPSSAASIVAEPFNRRMSRTPPPEARAQSFVPKRCSFEELGEDLDLGARPLPSHPHTHDAVDPVQTSSRASSRNGYVQSADLHERGSEDLAYRRVLRRPSDEQEVAAAAVALAVAASERARPRLSDERFEADRDDVETARASASLYRSQSPPPPPPLSPDPDRPRPGSATHNGDGEYQDASGRSPPPAAARFKADGGGRSDVAESSSSAAAAATASGYRTPALGSRALRSSLATSQGARSAGRSLRKLARSSNHHVPARRVQRYQDEEEDEDLDDEAKGGKAEHDNGSGNNSSGEGGGGGRGLHASGSSASGSGSRGRADERDGISPRLRAYGYDPVEAKSRAELLERASLVRSPSPPASSRDAYAFGRGREADAADDVGHDESSAAAPPPPPPSKKEQHPNARRAASGENVQPARKENLDPASANGRRRPAGANANAMQDILAAKIPAPGAHQADGLRRNVPLSSTAIDGARSAFAPSTAQNQPKAGAAPLVPSSVPPPPPEGMAEGDEEIDDEVYRQYSDCRPDLIWGEAERQLEQPLANHANLMELIKGPPKATAMQGMKYRKVKKAGRGGFSVVWVVRGPLYEQSPASPQDVDEVPEDRQAFFALKQVSLKEVESEQNRQELISEANTLRTLANLEGSEKYLLRYFGHRVSNDKLKILLELGDADFNGILATQAPLSRDLIAHYWREMLEAVQFIHDANLVHTDLKPANFLIVKNRIKLIDFGIAQNIPKGTVHISRDAIIGTPNYMAPEAIKIAKAKGRRVYKAGKPSDVWSLGCILYQMIYGRPPFDKIPSDRKLEGIMDPTHKILYTPYRDPRYPDVLDVDEDLLDCVKSALRYNVEDRATIPQLLQHPFLKREQEGEEERVVEEQEEDLEEKVQISRATLRDLVGRLRILALREELREENVIERADMLFNNLKQTQS